MDYRLLSRGGGRLLMANHTSCPATIKVEDQIKAMFQSCPLSSLCQRKSLKFLPKSQNIKRSFSKCSGKQTDILIRRKSATNSNKILDEKNSSLKNLAKYFGTFPREELNFLTENEEALPLLEAILQSPLYINDWEKVSKGQRVKLRSVTDAFNPVFLPSVTHILSKTASPTSTLILNRWIKKKKAELGEEGYQKFMKNLTGEGIKFHTKIENFLTNGVITESKSGDWKSIEHVLQNISDVKVLEDNILHPILYYKGKLDCVARYKDKLCIIDWKLSLSKKETLKKCYDNPYQIAAYLGAYNMQCEANEQISEAIIVKAYRNGDPAHVHLLKNFQLEFFWNGWLRRLAKHHIQIYLSQFDKEIQGFQKPT